RVIATRRCRRLPETVIAPATPRGGQAGRTIRQSPAEASWGAHCGAAIQCCAHGKISSQSLQLQRQPSQMTQCCDATPIACAKPGSEAVSELIAGSAGVVVSVLGVITARRRGVSE